MTLEIVCNTSDIVAILFLLVMTAVAIAQHGKDARLNSYIAGTLILITGISCRMLVRAFDYVDTGQTSLEISDNLLTLIKIIGFSLIYLSVEQFFSLTKTAYYTYYKGRQISFGCRFVINVLIMAATVILYTVFGINNIWGLVIMVELILGCIYCITGEQKIYNKAIYLIASLIAMTSFIVEQIWPQIRLTGLGLALFCALLYTDYSLYIGEELLKKEIELANNKVRLLAGQISPHFIFNSLQTIQGLCDTDPGEVKEAIANLSGYLRGNLESLTEQNLIDFDKELEHTREYIALEQLGRSRSFDVEYKLGVTEFKLPPLVLEPVVENAVKYGIGSSSDGGKIIIETEEKDDQVIIKVTDPGHRRNDTELRFHYSKSVGLDNVRARLETQCRGTLDLEKTDNGTTVVIILPMSL